MSVDRFVDRTICINYLNILDDIKQTWKEYMVRLMILEMSIEIDNNINYIARLCDRGGDLNGEYNCIYGHRNVYSCYSVSRYDDDRTLLMAKKLILAYLSNKNVCGHWMFCILSTDEAYRHQCDPEWCDEDCECEFDHEHEFTLGIDAGFDAWTITVRNGP